MAVTPLTVLEWRKPINGTTVQEPAGTAANVSGGGNTFQNDGRTMLQIINSTASATTVTVDVPGTGPGGTAITDPVVSLAASIHNEWIGPFDPSVYGDTVTVTASANTVKFNVWHMN